MTRADIVCFLPYPILKQNDYNFPVDIWVDVDFSEFINFKLKLTVCHGYDITS